MQYIILLFLFAIIYILLKEFYDILFRGYAPFIPSGGRAIKRAVDEIQIQQDGTVYELGCGEAGFLRALRKKYPKAKLFGIEYNIVPYIIGQIQNSLSNSKIRFLKKNFFKVDLHDADAVYCFLSIKSMAELEKKFKAECKPGTLIISYHFTMPNMQPVRVVEMENKNKIYFYNI